MLFIVCNPKFGGTIVFLILLGKKYEERNVNMNQMLSAAIDKSWYEY